MSTEVNVVVTCTERKKRAVPSALQFRSIPGRVTPRTWTRRLEEQDTDVSRAIDLYAGDHWSVVRELAETGKRSGVRVRLWVCSAGYGLVPADALLKPYSATFSAHKPDSVVTKTGLSRREWWRSVAEWEGPDQDQPRTLTALAQRYPKAPLWFAGSDRYLDAVEEDLKDVATTLRAREQLAVFSTGARPSRTLQGHVVPSGARLKPQLGGGSMHSLNVRLVRYTLENLEARHLTIGGISELFQSMLKEAPEMVSHDRKPMSDDEVRAFIRTEFAKNPKAKHSPLLRVLRDSGRACEQKRFAELFKAVREEAVRGD